MKSPVFKRPRLILRHDARINDACKNERGVTMLLVAAAMVAIIGMAALSIDVVTLYVDREQAQRSADAAALAAARIISVSGITGTASADTDPTSWQAVCGTSGTATQVAQQVGALNAVSGSAGTVTVTYSAQGATGGANDCSGLGQAFAINPSVTVKVQRTGLPTMFSRIWSRNTNTVSATATAEAFNPSASGNIAPGGETIPVVPRCVKPLIIPDEDPTRPAGNRFVHRFTNFGAIWNPGIKQVDGGVIGEEFTLKDDCGAGANCALATNPPSATGNVIYYFPALVDTGTSPVAAPSCATDQFQTYVAGCDVGTVYACGKQAPNGAQADLTVGRRADISAGMQCLINTSGGSDTIDTTGGYPFQIKAGAGNAIAATNQVITSSNSIITLPLYDESAGGGSPVPLTPPPSTPQITIVGFLQVFVKTAAPNGDMDVVVLNASGCTENASITQSAPGSSPVPIRLITPQ